MFALRLAILAAILAPLAPGDGPPVTLRIDSVGDNPSFRIGQAIPIAIDYATQTQQSFDVNLDLRMHCKLEAFSAAPKKGVVELPVLNPQWGCPMMGAGPASVKLDSLHPVHIELDLNQFLEFRNSGRYVIRAVSNRVSGFEQLKSNDLVLNILPRDDIEDAKTFQSAKAKLEAEKPPKEPQRIFYQDKQNQQIDAVRTLRYLETEQATAYLASLFGEPGRPEEEIQDALYASPYRDSAISVLEEKLKNPELAITQNYTITLFELKRSASATEMGRQPSKAETDALFEAVNQQILEAAAFKAPQARADTYYFLFATGSASLRDNPAVQQKLIQYLPDASDYVLENMLTSFWDRISDAGPELIPLLRQTATRRSESWQLHVAGAALHRLEQLDPEAANAIALNDLLAGDYLELDPQLVEFSLKPSREIDEALVKQYSEGKQVDVRIGRFASARVERELWRAFDARIASQPKGAPVCVTPLFAYFFRVDPKAAAERLDAIRHPPYPCTALQFNGFEGVLMSAGLERQLLLDTKSSNGFLWRPAMQFLRDAGSIRALPVLMEQLESAPPETKREQIFAILGGHNWFLSQRDFSTLEEECKGTDACQQVQYTERQYHPPYLLRLMWSSPQDGFALCDHVIDNLQDLEKAISQFPAHSKFRWEQMHNPITRDELEMRDEVRAALAKHGMVLLD